MVAILEPFIDTIIICFLTGLVLLSSGVWKEKLPNQFQKTDIEVLTALYSENKPSDVSRLENHLNQTARLPLFSGKLDIKDGQLQENVSIIHARSLASPFDQVSMEQGVVHSCPHPVQLFFEPPLRADSSDGQFDIGFTGQRGTVAGVVRWLSGVTSL